ncbi:hypothetical protein BVY04_04885, partial [bacterium M21]
MRLFIYSMYLCAFFLCSVAAVGQEPTVKHQAPPATTKLLCFYPHRDQFWIDILRYAQAAAKQLNVEMDTFNYSFDTSRIIDKLDQLRADNPYHGVIIRLYDKDSEIIMSKIQSLGIPAFTFNSEPPDIFYGPRTRYAMWVGHLSPDYEGSSMILAERLLAVARKKGLSSFDILAINGRKTDTPAIAYSSGIRKQISGVPEVNSINLVPGNWDSAVAANVFREEIAKNPKINVVWVANDNMALAVLEEAEKLGISKQVVIGGIDWSSDARNAISENRYHVSVGGHFFEAALTVIIMQDYLHGKDFTNQGINLSSGMLAFTSETRNQIQTFLDLPPDKLDFKKLSKMHTPRLARYPTDILEIIKITNPVSHDLNLSASESQWLIDHPKLSVGIDPNRFPVEYTNRDSQHLGIASDYLTFMKKSLGVTFTYTQYGTGPDVLQRLEKGDIDLLSATIRTSARDQKVHYTSPFLSIPIAIYTRSDAPMLATITQLNNRSLALVEGNDTEAIFRSQHPEITIIPVPSVEDGVRMLSQGKCDAFAEGIFIANHAIAQAGISNLRLSINTPYNHDFCMASQNSTLISILNKALSTIDPADREAWIQKWVSSRVDKVTDYTIVLQVVVVALLILMVFVYWIRRLSSEIKFRRQVQLELQVAKSTAEAANQAKTEFLA